MTDKNKTIKDLKQIAKTLEDSKVRLVLQQNGKINFKFTGDNEQDKKEARSKIKELLPTIKKHKEKLIKVIDEVAYQRFIQEKREENKFDPRQDLKEDSDLWKLFLKTAYNEDTKVYEIMHGYRCLGTRLKVEDGNVLIDQKRTIKESDAFKNKKAWQRGLSKHIKPIKDDLKAVLKKVNEKYEPQKSKAV